MPAKRMNIQQKYGVQIWRFIKTSVSKYATIQVDEITPETRADELFNANTDDGKNRYGQVFFDTFKYIEEISGVELSIDYKGRSEFSNFPEIKDIWIYFINKLEDQLEGAVIIPFPKRNNS